MTRKCKSIPIISFRGRRKGVDEPVKSLLRSFGSSFQSAFCVDIRDEAIFWGNVCRLQIDFTGTPQLCHGLD